MIDLTHLIRQLDEGVSRRAIAKNLNLSKTTIQTYSDLFKELEISLSDLRKKSNNELYEFLSSLPSAQTERMQHFTAVLKKYEFGILSKSLSRKEIYDEYLKSAKDALSYSQFCALISADLKTKDVHLHLEHKPGDKLFIDFAGSKLHYIDQISNKKITVEVFVSVLGHSQKAYIEAVVSQKIDDFLPVIGRALHYYGGVPQAIVPDNLKSAVTKASKYEAVINESFSHFCEHYDCYPFPARPHQPRDKNLVENAVGKAYQYIYKQVRKSEYYSLEELNKAIFAELEKFNSKNFSHRDYSRNDLFEQNEKQHLKQLPVENYKIVRFLQAKVRQEYHIWFSIDKHYYSVPFQYVGKITKTLYNADTVEIFCDYKRIATHKRNFAKYAYSTIHEHLPPNHKYAVDHSQEKLLQNAEKIGQYTTAVITKILNSKNYDGQKIKSGKGIMSLASKLGSDIIELCCKRAVSFGVANYQQIKNIADKKLYLEIETNDQVSKAIDNHKNQRGKDYFNKESVPVKPECCTS